MKNIRFHYMYRDGANFKNASSIIFTNHERLGIPNIREQIQLRLDANGDFFAYKWNLPPLNPSDEDWDNEIDHDYHRFCDIEQTDEEPTDPRTITEFLKQINTTE